MEHKGLLWNAKGYRASLLKKSLRGDTKRVTRAQADQGVLRNDSVLQNPFGYLYAKSLGLLNLCRQLW